MDSYGGFLLARSPQGWQISFSGFMDMSLIFEHFKRTDQLCSLKLFNARTIKDLVLGISKHFLLQLSRNNKTVEIYEKYALLFETCLTINKLTTTFNL